ncbi:MAG: hypothetical protein JXR25_16620 [Pontiellaceae bacterium]|nr:hypothetical protein [Pontiellaceae bacterium]MBN2786446.1 hypothetical protein [Pontiellaceae bacterium]
MKRLIAGAVGLMSLLMTGCIPENTVKWSPDLQQGAVLIDGNLYRCDSAGALSDTLLENVMCVAWRADSQGLVLARQQKMLQWKDVESLLGQEDKSRVTAVAEAVYAAWETSGNLDLALQSVSASAELSENLVKFYLAEVRPDMGLSVAAEDSVEIGVVQLARMDESGLTLGRVLGAGFDGIWDLRVSPDDTAVAFSSGDPEEALMPLDVVAFEEHVLFRVASGVSFYPDWSKDGRYLVYAVSNGNTVSDDLQLGALARRQVADDSGLLDELPDQEELVGLLFHPLVRVRCLPDDSIAFSAFEIHLPAVAGDMPEYMNFFRFDPRRAATVERMFPRSIEAYLGEWSMQFEPSPDGSMIAFLDSGNRVSVATVSSGEIQRVPDSDSEDFLPAWRGNSELYCVCSFDPDKGDGAKYYVARSRLDEEMKPVEFSAAWPDTVLEQLDD